jgi:hypothetical protein
VNVDVVGPDEVFGDGGHESNARWLSHGLHRANTRSLAIRSLAVRS